MKKAIILAAAVAVAWAWQAMGAVTVENVAVKQHWPWNGLVDIDYEIVSDDAEAQFLVYPKAEDKRLGKKVLMRTLSGAGAEGPVGPGAHRMVWDSKADMPGFHSPDVAVSIQTVSAAAEYMVVDISGGTNAVTYPVRFLSTGPDLANDACRTTELWLRLVLPGTFLMGSPSDEIMRRNNEVQHQVTLTRPYYLGVFELTQTQWNLIMGTTDVFYHTGPCRPVDKIAYSQVRGVSANGFGNAEEDISETSFLGILRRKTAMPFDLPTEAQWEYACRAGTTGAWNNGTTTSTSGSDANLNKLGRNWYNTGDGQESYTQHTKVGLYQPNAWGLYDMHGNVCEWCRDAYRAQWATNALVDPVGGDGSSSRVFRGGDWSLDSYNCRNASRGYFDASSIPSSASMPYYYPGGNSVTYTAGKFGFRVGCFPIE